MSVARGCGAQRGKGPRTFETADDDAQSVQLPLVPHPSVERGRDSPQKHATGHPEHHAISPSQGGTEGLQANEEGEEEGDGRVQSASVDSNVCGEVGRLCISNLSAVSL